MQHKKKIEKPLVISTPKITVEAGWPKIHEAKEITIDVVTPVKSSLNIESVEQALANADIYLRAAAIAYQTEDHRQKGGAFWLLVGTDAPEIKTRLLSLGFQFKSGSGYWIK